MGSKIPEVNDYVKIVYKDVTYFARITSISNSTLILRDINSNIQTSLTWNGTNWLLPTNEIPSNVILVPNMRPTVVDVRVGCIRPRYNDLAEWSSDPNNVYVGRPGIVFINNRRYPPEKNKFGNPYKPGQDGTFEEVLQKYRNHIMNMIATGEISKEEILALRGKVLGCWCKSKHPECHAEILADIVVNLSLSL